MITLSYRRFGNGIYISHTDVIRSLNRTIRRAGIDVNYSKGFNRHMSLKLTQPLPLGIASDDEWVTADVGEKIDKKDFFERFKTAAPPYIEATGVYKTEKNPSLASKVIASEYEIICPGIQKFREETEALKEGFTVVNEKDGEKKEKDYRGYIYDIKVTGDKIKCVFSFGNKNLRVDLFVKYINDKFGLNIPLSAVTRKLQLTEEDGKLITAKEYMERTERNK